LLGVSQEKEVDFNETFSPTLKQESIRILTSSAVQNNFNIRQIDITAAYLNANLTEDIYMKPPEGNEIPHKHFWKLKKVIYGLKQSGLAWNNRLNEVLEELEFIYKENDIFFIFNIKTFYIIFIYYY